MAVVRLEKTVPFLPGSGWTKFRRAFRRADQRGVPKSNVNSWTQRSSRKPGRLQWKSGFSALHDPVPRASDKSECSDILRCTEAVETAGEKSASARLRSLSLESAHPKVVAAMQTAAVVGCRGPVLARETSSCQDGKGLATLIAEVGTPKKRLSQLKFHLQKNFSEESEDLWHLFNLSMPAS